ncbi:hypothetical protein COY28_02275 [Candidatus Woesearchaeota archaeon CG_4_10_14_0_2_um_filter_57_5]|nr:MAG: hypothetical protein AUJ68_01010 [Candidatus Woesearchaeota archaeon CG1_02_57_44]PIN67472.1 MAG: hypothetical protein COV94_07255 [Candidatus Woesearchaeota archaeon CG11_big_fil_rev_8_21_14_0_20_57_5]PIZ54916.1 MAG: hypothetical protein COY28_02275 [Candidatus Woesearchaeota archaeon CG_4_10_14_0_2_um_filter_57_5]
MKKGTFSLQIVIIAVLLLIIMAVLVVIFANSSRNVVESTKSCSQKGGTCSNTCPPTGPCECNINVVNTQATGGKIFSTIKGTECDSNPTRVCCIPIN